MLEMKKSAVTRERRVRDGQKWQRVRDYLLSQVSAGHYEPGGVLPSESYLCDKVNVCRNTVRQALKELEIEGILYRVKGKGTFLAEVNSQKNQTKFEMFGLVIPGIRRSLYPSLTQGFDSRLATDNFQTMICQTDNDINKQGNIILRLLHKGIDGLAIVPATKELTPAYQIQMLLENDIPVVLCHRGVEGVKAPTILWDRQEVGRVAGKVLIEHGHKKIGYYGSYKYSVTKAHVSGLKAVMNEAGLELPDSHINFGSSGSSAQIEVARTKLIRDLLLSGKYTAIVCNDDDEAEKMCWQADKCGLKVPDDISIIGFGDLHRNTATREFLASIVIDECEIGRMAADILCDFKYRRCRIGEHQEMMLNVSLYPGDSVAKR